MSKTRPTAVNLFWAIERMRSTFNRDKALTDNVEELKEKLVAEALKIFQKTSMLTAPSAASELTSSPMVQC